MRNEYYPTAPGKAVEKNDSAWVDYSNAAHGYITAECLLEDLRLCKTEISKGEEKVIFDMYPEPDVLPLMFGDGKYGIKIFAQVPNTDLPKYSVVLETTIDVKMPNQEVRFRYPNQRVNYKPTSKAVAKTNELCKAAKTDTEKITRIYAFVIDNFTYDYDLAVNVKPRYLPDCDRTLERKKGICCDIAELFAVMCRSQGLFVKYATGYVADIKHPNDRNRDVYHAYNHIRVDKEITLPCGLKISKNKWTIIDPTFAISGKGSKSYVDFVSNSKNYNDKHLY